MDQICPLYLKSSECTLKILSNPRIVSFLLTQDFPEIRQKWSQDCKGLLTNCSFVPSEEATPEVQEIREQEIPKEQEIPEVVIETEEKTRVSIHKVENPYLVKSDVLVYPTNIGLTIDDPLLNRMSRGRIQSECDKF